MSQINLSETFIMKKTVLFALIIFSFWACGKEELYEGYKTMPNKQWLIDSLASFPFTITENKKTYNLYYNIQNTLRYPYYNLFVNYELLDASGKVLLTKQIDNNLLNPKTGEPYGKGLGDMYAHDFILLQEYQFPKNGLYSIRLKQAMRLDTLPEIVAVGIKVLEKE
jgi:gliding motility-associated lipoprotein GldH